MTSHTMDYYRQQQRPIIMSGSGTHQHQTGNKHEEMVLINDLPYNHNTASVDNRHTIILSSSRDTSTGSPETDSSENNNFHHSTASTFETTSNKNNSNDSCDWPAASKQQSTLATGGGAGGGGLSPTDGSSRHQKQLRSSPARRKRRSYQLAQSNQIFSVLETNINDNDDHLDEGSQSKFKTRHIVIQPSSNNRYQSNFISGDVQSNNYPSNPLIDRMDQATIMTNNPEKLKNFHSKSSKTTQISSTNNPNNAVDNFQGPRNSFRRNKSIERKLKDNGTKKGAKNMVASDKIREVYASADQPLLPQAGYNLDTGIDFNQRTSSKINNFSDDNDFEKPRKSIMKKPSITNLVSTDVVTHSQYIKKPSPAFEYLLRDSERRGRRRICWCLWAFIVITCLLLISICAIYLIFQWNHTTGDDPVSYRLSFWKWVERSYRERHLRP